MSSPVRRPGARRFLRRIASAAGILSLVIGGVLVASPAHAVPGPVTITSPGANETFPVATDGTTGVQVRGTAGAEQTVRVAIQRTADDSYVLNDSVQTDAAGNWMVGATGLTPGGYRITAWDSVDGTNSQQRLFRVVTERTPVTITSPTDAMVLEIAPGSSGALHVSGTAETGYPVFVTVAGTTSSADPNSDGVWVTAPFTGLAPGLYSAVATQTVAGTASSDRVDFRVVEVAPPEVVPVQITSPAEGHVFDIGVGETQDVEVSGAGQPGAQISINMPGYSSGVAVRADGTWTATFEQLSAGAYRVGARQDFAGGFTLDYRDFEIREVGDEVIPVTIASPISGAVYTLPASGGLDVEVKGAGHPGHKIFVKLSNGDDATVVADDEGAWSTVFRVNTDDKYVVQARDDANGTSASTSFAVRPAGVDPAEPTNPTDPTNPGAGTDAPKDDALAATGGTLPWAVLGLAAFLLASGVLLVMGRARRRQV